MYKKYLNITRLENYNFQDIKNAIGLFNNQEEYFEVLKEKEFKAYKIVLKDVLRNNEQLELLKSKYKGITDRELVSIAEMLFISDINELNKLNKDDMLK